MFYDVTYLTALIEQLMVHPPLNSSNNKMMYRLTAGECNVESPSNIARLSSTLSWLDPFTDRDDDVTTVITHCARRSLIYPYLRYCVCYEDLMVVHYICFCCSLRSNPFFLIPIHNVYLDDGLFFVLSVRLLFFDPLSCPLLPLFCLSRSHPYLTSSTHFSLSSSIPLFSSPSPLPPPFSSPPLPSPLSSPYLPSLPP